MKVARWHVLAIVGALVLASCATDTVVTTQQADQLNVADVPATTEPVPQATPAPDETAGSADPGPTSAPTTTPPVSDPAGAPPDTVAPDQQAIDFGPAKPPRAYDDLLLATLTDLQAWWSEEYPVVYTGPFTPLTGSVYAAYPTRPDDLPGCGTPSTTTYDEVVQFVAFYCGDGDFIVYDDGADGLLAQLADRFGPSTIGIVLAHEFGHAIQLRNGALDLALPTITTEQQADCFAGAWAGRASRGESPWVSFTDRDVRSGLIAMLEVRDPVGVNQFSQGGHGSGFDRVGAFQVGFNEGLSTCARLIDDPLPLMPNEFFSQAEVLTGGNAPLTFGEDGLLTFLPDDLNLYWATELDSVIPGFDGLQVETAESTGQFNCTDPTGDFDDGVALCASTATVYLNLPVAQDLHRQSQTFGDFSIGYLLGVAWAEAAQQALGSTLVGEERELINDCLVGAWVQTVIPTSPGQLPLPRAEGRTATVSPGDLDEAIRTQILIGDAAAVDDEIGTPFEKIEAFRDGVIGGITACGV